MLFDFIAEQCYISFGLATIASSHGFGKNLKIRKMTKIGGIGVILGRRARPLCPLSFSLQDQFIKD